MKKTIFYATTNNGKFDEIKRYIEENNPSIELKQFNEDIPEAQTTDQKAIAITKAEKAWELLKKPVLVDDSGIFFDHYNNFPGTLSKLIFHGIGFEGLLRLAEVDSRARMMLTMIYKEKDEGYVMFDGTCKGIIVRPKKFDAHPKLPYDAIFMPAGANKTMAEIRGTKEENIYSYRIIALTKFLNWFKEKEA